MRGTINGGMALGAAMTLVASLTFATGCNTVEKTTTKMMDRAQCRAIQTEAKTALRALVAAQSNYKSGRDTYAKTIGDLGVEVEEATIHYKIRLVEVTKDKFIAEARADDPDLGSDTWRIDGEGKLENTRDGCQ